MKSVELDAGFIALIRQFPTFAHEHVDECVLADADGNVEGFFPDHRSALDAGYKKFGLGQFWLSHLTTRDVAAWTAWVVEHDAAEAEYASWDNRLLLLAAAVAAQGEMLSRWKAAAPWLD